MHVERARPNLGPRRHDVAGIDVSTGGTETVTNYWRLKLATELHKTGSVYVLDEPTTGLHLSDIGLLMGILDRLVDAGNTVVLIEGPPAHLQACARSLTARFL